MMGLRCLGVLLCACLFLVLYCSSSSTVQGIPVSSKSRSSKVKLSKLRISKSDDLNRAYRHPTMRVKGQLVSRTGYFVEILQNGTIQSTLNKTSIYTILEIQTYNKTLKRFFGVHSGYYLACEIRGKRKGKIVGQRHLTNDSLFVEHMEENGFLTYRPLTFPSRYPNSTGFLAIKENGKFRRVERSKPGMHASQFHVLSQL